MKKKKIISLLLASIMTITMSSSSHNNPGNRNKNIYGVSDAYYDWFDDIDSSYPIKDMGLYVPQGICIIDDHMLVSLYDSTFLCNSLLYMFDMNGDFEAKIELDIDSHVGGIDYDSVNHLIWISGSNGSVYAYKESDILNKKKVKSIYHNSIVGNNLINYRGQKAVSFLTIYDNSLYVGNYTDGNNSTLKKYNISCYKDNVSLSYDKSFTLPDKIQGITLYNKDNCNYIVLSRSYGRYSDSILQIYKYVDEDHHDYNGDDYVFYELPPIMEQVTFDEDKLYLVCERNAMKYNLLNNKHGDDILVYKLKDQ